jgi:hypothetical protein
MEVTSTTDGKFRTDRLDVAIYLMASQSLKLTNIERVNPTKVNFLFNDPCSKGDEFVLNFDNGAHCSAKSLFASQRFVRTQMTKYVNRNRNTPIEGANVNSATNHTSSR